MRKISVSIFDGVSNGGALREICDFAGGTRIYERMQEERPLARPIS